MRPLLISACALAFGASAIHAQKPELARVDSLLAAGESTRAAALLKEWQQTNSADHNPHALYLAAQLQSDAEAARELYLSIALSHPTSSYAPPALLRLGQLSHAAGDWQRAVGYLDRLLTDYPGAKERESGYLWLMRANMAAGRSRDACTLAGVALRGEVRDPAVSEQVRGEERRACGAANSEPPAAQAPNTRTSSTSPAQKTQDSSKPTAQTSQTSTAQPAPEKPRQPTPLPAASAGASPETNAAANRRETARTNARFAVQAGAFKETRGATSVANGLKKAGFDARVTKLEGTTLNHVRVGYFENRADAVAMVQKLRSAGFNAMIVDDVMREK